MSDESPGIVGVAPALLVSMPQLADPNFHRTVILLCEHGADGAFGLVLNRRTETPAASVVQLSPPVETDNGLELWIGGPVEPERGWILTGTEPPDAESVQVTDGVFLRLSVDLSGSATPTTGCLPSTANASAHRLRRLECGTARCRAFVVGLAHGGSRPGDHLQHTAGRDVGDDRTPARCRPVAVADGWRKRALRCSEATHLASSPRWSGRDDGWYFVPINLSVFHHKPYVPNVRDVVEWVAVDRHEISLEPRRDRPNLVAQTEGCGRHGGRRMGGRIAAISS